MKSQIFLLLFLLSFYNLNAQDDLIVNTQGRKTISLNGIWHYVVDPYETGGYDYRLNDKKENDPGAYWNVPTNEKKSDWTEHGYKVPYSIQVPGDWNSQVPGLNYYEGSVWYHNAFDKPVITSSEDVYLYFGAVNYEANVYNGKKLGSHK